jgi:hypothetical protein
MLPSLAMLNVLSCKVLGCVCLCHAAVCLKKQHVKDKHVNALWEKHNKAPSLRCRLIRVESCLFRHMHPWEHFFVFLKSAIF